jgi:REP element-mobilizing transposase RayT
VGNWLKEICIEISNHYKIHFLEIDYEENHVYFLIQRVPNSSIREICMKAKKHYSEKNFQEISRSEKKLCGGNFWTSGCYANTVGQYGNKDL